MTEIKLYQGNLPSTIEDLSRFALIGRDKLTSVRAEISAIKKLGLAKEVHEQKLKEAQEIAELVTRAEVRVGEMLAEIPKATPNNNQFHEIDSGVELVKPKAEVIQDLGFTQKQAERIQTMAQHPEIVEQAIAEARENEDIVSRSFILEKIKTEKRNEREAKREEKRFENAEKVSKIDNPLEAQGLFQTIVIDPPWDWGDEGDINQLGRAKPDYATMPIEELEKLPIAKISDDNCHLYVWVTNRSLPKAFRLIEAWGFRYITCITWVKPSFGMGNYFRGSTEQVLFAVKGSQPLKRKDIPTHFQAPRGKGHSAKPDHFYDIIQSCSHAPFIDVFGRKEREGWSVWGE